MITGFLVQFASVDSYKAVTVAVWLHSAIADDLAKNAYVVYRLISVKPFLAG